MKRVLLTGARGFIGGHCVGPLLERGYEVHALSRCPGENRRVTWHTGDLLKPGTPGELIDQVRPSHLLHLAWYVIPGKLIHGPENLDWVTASLDLLRRFADQGGRRACLCGSGYEYDWSHGYCVEGLTPCVPDTLYGACKHALHEMARTFADGRELSLAWARVFFLYGPNEHPDRLVPSVIRSLLRSEPARTSHGRQIRDYLHVQDVAEGLVTLLDSELREAVNVSSGRATTLRDIASTIGRLTGRPELIQFGAVPARPNDVPLVVGSNARIAGLGWQQRYDLESGLLETIDWWRRQEPQGVNS